MTQWLTGQQPEQLLRELGNPETWRRLAVLMQIVPDGRLTLPVRTDFQQLSQHQHSAQLSQRHISDGSQSRGVYNIGQVYLRSRIRLWYTLADVLAGIIRDGALPTIKQALEFVPSHEKAATHALEIAGVLIDPSRDIVNTKLIDLRRSVKKRAAQARASGRSPAGTPARRAAERAQGDGACRRVWYRRRIE